MPDSINNIGVETVGNCHNNIQNFLEPTGSQMRA